ncbi:hypothetical protein ACH54D_02430 [Atlantibacter hermannii]|uniref:hypothetical protein n=1 Tax=Atlantibacter hermannii TaxID=565 RepID=UPI0037A8D509
MEYITKTQVAKRYGFDLKSISNWMERGANSCWCSDRRKFREPEIEMWVINNILAPLRTVDTSEAIKQAKLDKLRSEANITQMEEREKANSLIPVALVQAALSKYCSQVRTSMTQISTTQARFLLEQATDSRSLKEALQRVIVERLNEIGAVMESDSFFDDPDLTDISEDNGTTYPVDPVLVVIEPDFFNEGEE